MTAMARKGPENADHSCGRSGRERLLVVVGMCTAALVSAGDPVFAQTAGYNLGVTTALDAHGVAADATDPGTKAAGGNGNFFTRLFKAYVDGFRGVEEEAGPEPPRRALPAPFDSPPFPSAEYQGYPLIGVPYSTSAYPLMEAIYGGPGGDAIKASRIKLYGWVNASGSFSNADTRTCRPPTGSSPTRSCSTSSWSGSSERWIPCRPATSTGVSGRPCWWAPTIGT